MKRTLHLAMVIAGCFSPAAAQIDWTPYEGNPVIATEFDIESQDIYRPSVVKWNGRYHMWYGKFWLQTRWVAYTTSADGIAWSNTPPLFDNAVLGPTETPGAFDEIEATYGSVILDGDTLKMWYAGRATDMNGIGLAWSTDGSAWTRVPGPAGGESVLDPTADATGAAVVTLPAVIKHGETYHMWYVRITPAASILEFESRIGYARSPDGVSWQVISGPGQNGAVIDLGTGDDFDATAILYPAVIHNGEMFEMWYQGVGPDRFAGLVSRVGCARSADGVSWDKVSGSHADAGACFNSLAQPFVLLEDGVYKMWYALSAAHPNDDVVMYATSGESPTTVEGNEIPTLAGGLEIYPNPTVAYANVRFELKQTSAVTLEVYDLLGRLITQNRLGTRAAGDQLATWNRLDARGAPVPAGAYVVSIVNSSTGERAAAGIVHVLLQ